MKYFDDYKKHYMKTMGWKIYYARRAKGIAAGLALAKVRLLSLQTVEVEEQEAQDDSD